MLPRLGLPPVSSCTPPYYSCLTIYLTYPPHARTSSVACGVPWTFGDIHTLPPHARVPSPIPISSNSCPFASRSSELFRSFRPTTSLSLTISRPQSLAYAKNSHPRITRPPTPATHRCIYTCTYLSTLTTPPAHRSIPPSSSSSPPLVIGKYGCFVKCIAHSTVPLIAMRYCSFGTCACTWTLVVRSCFAYVQYPHTTTPSIYHAGDSGADKELVAAAGASPSPCILVEAFLH